MESPDHQTGNGSDSETCGRALLKNVVLDNHLKIVENIEPLLAVCYQQDGSLIVKVRLDDPENSKHHRDVEFLEVLQPEMIPPGFHIDLRDLMQLAGDDNPLALICCAIAAALAPVAQLTIQVSKESLVTFSLFINEHAPQLYEPDDVDLPLKEFSGFLTD